jgi:hypothetical protein
MTYFLLSNRETKAPIVVVRAPSFDQAIESWCALTEQFAEQIQATEVEVIAKP